VLENSGRRRRLEAEDRQTAHLIGHLSGYDLSDSPVIRPLLADPASLSALARTAAVNLFVSLARDTYLALHVEDLQHADDASLDLLNDLFRADDHLHLLVVCVSRPGLFDRRPEWEAASLAHTDR
jgi:hypothetical protein